MPASGGSAFLTTRAERLEHAFALLEAALTTLDGLGDVPELGARLDHLIEDLKLRKEGLTPETCETATA